jgi:hypothetical protein
LCALCWLCPGLSRKGSCAMKLAVTPVERCLQGLVHLHWSAGRATLGVPPSHELQNTHTLSQSRVFSFSLKQPQIVGRTLDSPQPNPACKERLTREAPMNLPTACGSRATQRPLHRARSLTCADVKRAPLRLHASAGPASASAKITVLRKVSEEALKVRTSCPASASLREPLLSLLKWIGGAGAGAGGSLAGAHLPRLPIPVMAPKRSASTSPEPSTVKSWRKSHALSCGGCASSAAWQLQEEGR